MTVLTYKQSDLYIENVSLKKIAATYGTPCYVYSQTAITNAYQACDHAFKNHPHQICYAVKANSNLAILQLLARLGAGFDIVSGGELARVLKAGGDPAKIVFSGVGKSSEEIERGINAGISCFNVESEAELERVNQISLNLNTVTDIALRINPNIDAHTHNHVTTGRRYNKFGIALSNVIPLTKKIMSMKGVRLVSFAGHIGSQILELKPLTDFANLLLSLYEQAKDCGAELTTLNIGGGLGITYRNEKPPSITEYANAIIHEFRNCPAKIILEPGRYIVENGGTLVTKVEYIKQTPDHLFAIVDVGLNDFMRPALYEAWQQILPVTKNNFPPKIYDIVGPVCESSDYMGKERELAIQQDDLLAIASAGAYGFSMSSNYNSRCRAAEVLVDGDDVHLIRRRESIEDLIAAENTLSYMAYPG